MNEPLLLPDNRSESDKKSDFNRLANLGEFGKNGGPGRPKGSKNKFTQIKEDLLELYEETYGKDRLRQLMNTKKGFAYVFDHIMSLVPKDKDSLDETTIKNVVINNITVNGTSTNGKNGNGTHS